MSGAITEGTLLRAVRLDTASQSSNWLLFTEVSCFLSGVINEKMKEWRLKGLFFFTPEPAEGNRTVVEWG